MSYDYDEFKHLEIICDARQVITWPYDGKAVGGINPVIVKLDAPNTRQIVCCLGETEILKYLDCSAVSDFELKQKALTTFTHDDIFTAAMRKLHCIENDQLKANYALVLLGLVDKEIIIKYLKEG